MLGSSLAQLLDWLKLGWILWFIIKCLIQSVMEICYHDYLFSISVLGYACSLHMLCRKFIQKTSMGKTHRDAETKLDWEIHEIRKVINQGPRTTKWTLSSHHGGLPSLLLGPPSLSLCLLVSRFVHGQVWAQHTLFSYVSFFVLNRIENHMVKQLKTWGKIILVMT
jgi:hypothetical protein